MTDTLEDLDLENLVEDAPHCEAPGKHHCSEEVRFLWIVRCTGRRRLVCQAFHDWVMDIPESGQCIGSRNAPNLHPLHDCWHLLPI